MKMNRRQFLRLTAVAGVGSLLTGCQAFLRELGLTQIPTPTPTATSMPTATSTLTPTSTPTPTPTPIPTYTTELTLYQAIHGGPWREDESNLGSLENPPILVVNGRSISPDSDGKYRLRNLRRGPVKVEFDPESLGNFRYGTPNSNSEVWRLRDGYGFTVDPNKLEILFGLMEGFLTLPIDPSAPYYIWSYLDLDPGLGRVMSYRGDTTVPPELPDERGVGTHDQHQGIDYNAPIGTPILAAAPGSVFQASPNENCPDARSIRMLHEILGYYNGRPQVVEIFAADYGHNSRNDVVRGQRGIRRGQRIALCGDHLGDNRPPCNHPHLHFEVWEIPRGYWEGDQPINYIFEHVPRVIAPNGDSMPIAVDPYRCVVDNPPVRFKPEDYPDVPESYMRSPGYWTVTNNPQAPVV